MNQNQQYQDLYEPGTSYTPHPVFPATIDNPTYLKHLIQSIIQLVYFVGVPLVPLILTISANKSWKNGDHEAYRKKTKVASVFLIIGWIYLGIEVIVLLGFAFDFLSFRW